MDELEQVRTDYIQAGDKLAPAWNKLTQLEVANILATKISI